MALLCERCGKSAESLRLSHRFEQWLCGWCLFSGISDEKEKAASVVVPKRARVSKGDKENMIRKAFAELEAKLPGTPEIKLLKLARRQVRNQLKPPTPNPQG